MGDKGVLIVDNLVDELRSFHWHNDFGDLGKQAADEIERLREGFEKILVQEDSECVFTKGYERTLTTMTGPIGLQRCQEIACKALNND